MSLYDKMTIGFGSGFGAGVGTLFNLKPTDGTGDFTVVRNDTGPSEIISNGDFASDTVWTKGTGWTIAAGVATTDGTVANLTQGGLSITSGVNYFVEITTSGTYSAEGLKVRLGTANLATITQDGSFTFEVLADGSGTFGVYIENLNDFVGDIDDVSVKSADYDFISSVVDSNLLIDKIRPNVPRSNYPLTGGCPHLLLEPEITNLLTYSEEFNNAIWVKNSGATATANQTTAPDNTLTADKVNGDDSADYVYQIPTTTATNTYTFSLFVKNAGANTSTIVIRNTSTSGSLDINWTGNILTSLTLNTGVSSSFEDYGNGWYRVVLTYVESLANQYIRITPTSIAETKSIYVWGANLEELDYKTSYVKTIASTLTREADACTGAGTSSDYNSLEGVLYLNMAALADDGTFRTVSITDGTFDNVIYIRYNSISNQITAFCIVATVTQAEISYTLTDSTDFNKIAFKWSASDFSLWVNGVNVGTDTAGDVFPASTLDELRFNAGGTAQIFYGKCKELAVFNEALTDLELTKITT